jgi:hypothetical protein
VSTVRRRHLAATALAATAALTLGGCGTSFDAQTNQVYQPAVGANHRGEVDVLNTLLVANPDQSATLSASLVNNATTQQTISSVEVSTLDGKQLQVRSTKALLPLPSGVLTRVGGGTDAGGFQVVAGATAGSYVEVTLTFSDSAPVTIEAPVVARSDGEYDDVAGARPTPSEPAPTEATPSANAE